MTVSPSVSNKGMRGHNVSALPLLNFCQSVLHHSAKMHILFPSFCLSPSQSTSQKERRFGFKKLSMLWGLNPGGMRIDIYLFAYLFIIFLAAWEVPWPEIEPESRQ